jgi:hypothetical protein
MLKRSENTDPRTWHHRICTLNGLFWGVGIAAGTVAYVRHQIVERPTDLTVAEYVLLFFAACIPSLPSGVFLSSRVKSLRYAESPPVEMTDNRLRLMLHRWEAATILFLLIAAWHQLWPVIPYIIAAFATTLPIVTSLFVLLMAGWAAYVRPGRQYGRHAVLGVILALATVGVWVLVLRSASAG